MQEMRLQGFTLCLVVLRTARFYWKHNTSNNLETNSNRENLGRKIWNRDTHSERSPTGLTPSARRQKSLHQRKFKESTNLCSKKSLFGKEISVENSEAEQQLSNRNETRSLMNIPATLYGAQLVPPNFSHQVSFSRRQFFSGTTFFFGTTFFSARLFFRHDLFFLARLFFLA